jgi:hypothetical protein
MSRRPQRISLNTDHLGTSFGHWDYRPARFILRKQNDSGFRRFWIVRIGKITVAVRSARDLQMNQTTRLSHFSRTIRGGPPEGPSLEIQLRMSSSFKDRLNHCRMAVKINQLSVNTGPSYTPSAIKTPGRRSSRLSPVHIRR